jgi:hypothetical protein
VVSSGGVKALTPGQWRPTRYSLLDLCVIWSLFSTGRPRRYAGKAARPDFVAAGPAERLGNEPFLGRFQPSPGRHLNVADSAAGWPSKRRLDLAWQPFEANLSSSRLDTPATADGA